MNRRQALELTWQFTKRDVLGRYRGSFLGLGWSLVAPLLMLSLYTFVFSTILQARWPGIESESSLLYAINLFAGLIIINFISEVATKASTLIIGHANYVKRVVFPLEILGVSTVLSAAFHSAISIVLLLIFQWIAAGSLSWSILSLPFLWLPLIIASLGLAWLISALGVYVRDTVQVINVAITLLLFLSPVFFPASRYPDGFKPLLSLNPLVWMIEDMRSIIINGEWPGPAHLLSALFASIVVAYVCRKLFQKARRGFADVL
jgi:lipopolysaccharide transport system permease protein